MLSKFLVVRLARVHLEIHNITSVPVNLLVVANVNLLGALRDQTHVVTDH
jgi:hypothetical protein